MPLSLRALGITEGEVITTPFSYVATISSILWERCTPIFVDIEADNFTINTNQIEEKITSRTRAIMPVHVFGYACDVERLEEISRKYSFMMRLTFLEQNIMGVLCWIMEIYRHAAFIQLSCSTLWKVEFV